MSFKNVGRAVCAAVCFVYLFFVNLPARACSVCGCGDPLVAARDSSPTPGRVRFALDSEYLSARARSDDNPSLTEYLTQITLRPVAVYSPIQNLNLVLQVPLIRKDWTLGAAGAPANAATPIGLGDVDLGGRFFLFNQVDFAQKRRQNFGISLGSSLPTGPNDHAEGGQRIDDHAQLGTGSWGPYAGVLYAFHQDPWNLFASVSARLHTTNRFEYHYGSAAQWTLTGQIRPWDPVALVLGIDGRYAEQDAMHGDLLENTGGLLLAAAPGLELNLYGELWLHAKAQIPVVSRFFGEQSVGPTFMASLQYTVN